MKAIVVDDELEVVLPVIEQYVNLYTPEVKLIGTANNIEAAYNLIVYAQPDLVFLDVQIGVDTGFDLLRKFLEPTFMVIFISGYEKQAVKAIRFGALDFLPKPIDLEEFQSAIKSAYVALKDQNRIKQLELTVAAYDQLKLNKRPSRIGITDLEGTLFLEIDKIIHLEADGNNTIFCVQDEDRKILSTRNIGTYVEQFEAYPDFMKTHRAHVINLKAVKKYIKGDRLVRMTDNHEVPVSQQNREELLKRLSSL